METFSKISFLPAPQKLSLTKYVFVKEQKALQPRKPRVLQDLLPLLSPNIIEHLTANQTFLCLFRGMRWSQELNNQKIKSVQTRRSSSRSVRESYSPNQLHITHARRKISSGAKIGLFSLRFDRRNFRCHSNYHRSA